VIRDIDARIRRALASIRQAVRIVIARVNSAPAVAAVSGEALAGEHIRDAELMQHYGMTSVPPAGTMGVVIPLGGRTSHGVVIATEHADYRLQSLESGEVALYTDEGVKTVFKRGRIIETECDVFRVNCKTFEVNAIEKSDFNTPVLTASHQAVVKHQLTGLGGLALSNMNGNSSGPVATITGTIHVTWDVIADGVSLRHHQHPVNAFGLTDEPQQ